MMTAQHNNDDLCHVVFPMNGPKLPLIWVGHYSTSVTKLRPVGLHTINRNHKYRNSQSNEVIWQSVFLYLPLIFHFSPLLQMQDFRIFRNSNTWNKQAVRAYWGPNLKVLVVWDFECLRIHDKIGFNKKISSLFWRHPIKNKGISKMSR